MSPDQRISLIVAITPIVVVILGGIGWLIRHVLTTSKQPPSPGVEISQGQTIPVTALPDFLIAELDETEAHARIYRDALVRAGIDPDDLLRAAGLIPPLNSVNEEVTT